MSKFRVLKSVICATSAFAAILSASALTAKAAPATSSVVTTLPGNGTANSLAGITLSLDNYYTTNTNELGDDEQAANKQRKQEAAEQEQPKKEEKKKVSKYENTGIAVVEKYVNVRKKPSTDSEVVGKVYKGAAVKVVKHHGDWVKVESGTVKGYVAKEFLAIGEEAEKVAEKYGKVTAKIQTETLRLREKKTTDSRILTLLAEDEKYAVKSHDDKWVQLQIDDDLEGYVAKEFVKVKVSFKKAISIKEEQEAAAKKAAQEAEIRRQREEQRRREEAAAAAAAANTSSSTSSSSSSSSTSTSKRPTTSKKPIPTKKPSTTGTSSSSSSSKSGSAVANYALQFVGNPYRWGGTSLTNGADCSGFTMSVYRHFGISLPRTSSSQAGAGRSVSLSSLQAGDLLFYGNGGGISHVAIYIGGGKIVHASNKKDGIKVSNYRYKTPICARRVL